MDLQEALATAIDFEHKVRDHYAECARASQDPKGSKVFAILAREEQGHVEYLETRLGEWKVTGAVTAGELPSVLPSMAQIQAAAATFAANTPAAMANAGNPNLPELEFLKQALELERKTSGFYRDMVAQLAPADRELFARFLDIEDGHVTLVQAEIDALVGHGHWFDFMEFSLEM